MPSACSRQSANLGIVVEVVGGLYEGSSLASIPSCNESSLRLLIGARVDDVFLLRGRAADGSFIRRPSQQLPGDRVTLGPITIGQTHRIIRNKTTTPSR